MHTAERIKLELHIRKISQAKLAEMTGIPIMTIQNILHGRSKKTEFVKRIADALGLSLDYILQDNVTETYTPINLIMFEKAVKIALAAIKKYKNEVNKIYLIDLIFYIHAYISNNDASDDICIAYAEGFIQRDIDTKKV